MHPVGIYRLHRIDCSPAMNSAPANHRGMLLVISGPSGVGKTTIVREVEKRLGAAFSVSATTRPRSPSEVDGRDYYFLDESEFTARLERGEFLEHACVFGKYWYGTPREPVERLLDEGRLVILDIDVQGARQVKEAMPEAFTVFILPPNEEVLLERLRNRRRDDPQAIERRFAVARDEIAFAHKSGCYDALVVNDDLEAAIAQIVELAATYRAT